MLNKLLSCIRQYDMVQEGDQIVCAVSGGADSIALLWSFYLLKEKLGIRLSAAHFNHHLRGEESQRDEAFVRAFCEGYQIPLIVGEENVQPGEKGLEAAAREARYRFFDTLPGKIATAHTADDNAETVIMHMVRGTGLKGLGGIAPVRGRILRPMLFVTRCQVMDFLQEYHLEFVEDSSNDTDQFLRNRLRHHVMPLLKAENPMLSENLSAMAMRLREDEESLSLLSKPEYPLEVEKLKAVPEAVRSRILSRFLEDCGVREPEAQHIAMARNLVFADNPSAKAHFPGNITVERCYGVLQKREEPQVIRKQELPCPGTLDLPQCGLRIHCGFSEEMQNSTVHFTVQPEGKLILRCRESGDEMRLPGGTKSLKKLFIDRKIPASCRQEIPVIADDRGVVGVYGIGVNLDRLSSGVEIRFEKLP